MKNKDSKNIILTTLGIAILFIAVIGISYAIYKFSQSSNVDNYVKTGTVSMQYTESDTNVISINNAVPTEDAVGKKQKDYFDFTLSSAISGQALIKYEVRAKQLDVSPKKALDSKCVNLYLEKKESGIYKEVLKPTVFNLYKNTKLNNSSVDLDTMLLYEGTFNNSQTTNTYSDDFRLRMWVNKSCSLGLEPQSFKVKVNVYAAMD